MASTHGWHEGASDPWPWLGYFTSVLAGAYAIFTDRAAAARTPGTKQQRVREHILRHAPATFRLADIRTALPGISDQTIRLVLEQLRNEGKIRPDGTGRSAVWVRVAHEIGLPATSKGKTGRMTLPLIARDAAPAVLVTNEDIAGALDAEDVERYAAG